MLELVKEIAPYLVSVLCAYVSYFIAVKQGKNRLDEIKELHKSEIEKMELQIKNKESEQMLDFVGQVFGSTMKSTKSFDNMLKNFDKLNNLDNK